MSDFFEGPGHWMASDGKWYPPERHPDPEYRARFTTPITPPAVPDSAQTRSERQDQRGFVQMSTVETTKPETPQTSPDSDTTNDVDASSGDTNGKVPSGEFPSVGLRDDQRAGVSNPLADLHRTSDVGEERREFSVASTDFGTAPDRPVFDQPATPASVSTARPNEERTGARVATSGIQLEFGRDASTNSRRSASVTTPPSTKLSTSTALAVIPTATFESPSVPTADRVLAAIIFCAGVAMIVGTFLDWTSGSVIQTGWDRGDGIATVIAGVVGSACAGPIYVGFRHILPKAVAIIAGLAGVVVVGLSAGTVLLDSGTAATSLGNGAIVTAVGAVAMVLAGLVHRIDYTY